MKTGAGEDKLAKKWADLMTQKYEELSLKMPVFAELRNTIDMSIVATLIVQENLAQKAGLDLAVLSGSDSVVEVMECHTPKTIEPRCSFIKGRGGWVVTTSGGVDVNAFEVVANQTTDESVSETQTLAMTLADASLVVGRGTVVPGFAGLASFAGLAELCWTS